MLFSAAITGGSDRVRDQWVLLLPIEILFSRSNNMLCPCLPRRLWWSCSPAEQHVVAGGGDGDTTGHETDQNLPNFYFSHVKPPPAVGGAETCVAIVPCVVRGHRPAGRYGRA
jgi:hypothetical protein